MRTDTDAILMKLLDAMRDNDRQTARRATLDLYTALAMNEKLPADPRRGDSSLGGAGRQLMAGGSRG